MSRKNYFDEDEDFANYDSEEEFGEYSEDEGEKYEGSFMPEAKAYERVMYNVPDVIAALQGPRITGKIGDIQSKLNKISLQPQERFMLQVNAVYNSLSEKGVISLIDGQIDIILNHIENIPNAEYKNPTAYILGYIASMDSTTTKLNRKNVENVLRNILPKLDTESSITEPDILRYARLWQLTKE